MNPEIVRKCMRQEKEGLELYREAARTASRESTRRAFEILIREEEEHIRRLFQRYGGSGIEDLDAFLREPGRIESPLVKELEKALDPELPDRKALEIAMRLEKENGEEYRRYAEKAQDPDVQEIYSQLARDEERHFEVVESEYAHLMAMVHETDVNIYVRE